MCVVYLKQSLKTKRSLISKQRILIECFLDTTSSKHIDISTFAWLTHTCCPTIKNLLLCFRYP